MSTSYRPPQEDIDRALEIERNVKPEDKALYMECMNEWPMSQRTTNPALRSGCILTQVYTTIINNRKEN